MSEPAFIARPDRAGQGQQRNVLIVEDQALIGLGLKDCLETTGAHVVWVETDRAAYAALKSEGCRFDTLLLDIDLGEGTTGFDVARFARNQFPDIGVIFSSGSPPDWLKAFGVEGALFVPKPCSEATLLSAFELVGRQRRIPAEVRRQKTV